MRFPPSRSLPSLLHADDLSWYPPSDHLRFWIGEDADGVRWLIKCRGGFYAVRERAFSIIAQALGIACQSSTFLKMSPRQKSSQFPRPEVDFYDVHQLAIWFLEEHTHQQVCENCPLAKLDDDWRRQPYDVNVLRGSQIEHAIDMARGQMLGMLCEMHEPPGCLFTRDHTFIQIDNEQMFSRHAGAHLCESPWVVDDEGRVRPAGLEHAIQLCEQVLSLTDETFRQAVRLPAAYRPRMNWSVSRETDSIRPRARRFLDWAAKQPA